MFRLLHRVYVGLFWCLCLALAAWAYTQRATLEPAWDYATLWWQRDRSGPAELPDLAGQVTYVFAGNSFQLRDDFGMLYNYGLAGVATPVAGPYSPPQERLLAGECRTNLEHLLLHHRVQIRVTLGNPVTHTGLGLVLCNGTNVNLIMLRTGWGKLQRDEIHRLPLETQYDLVRAARQAERQHVGLWAAKPIPPRTNAPTATLIP